MSTATIAHPTAATITEATPLTESEVNSLISLAASTEKIARVKTTSVARESRGWSLSGDID